MTLKSLLVVLASLVDAPPYDAGAADRLECFLKVQSPICTGEICPAGSRLYTGKSVRLFLDLTESTADLNGILGTLDQVEGRGVVRWQLGILGDHAMSRHEVEGRTFITLYGNGFGATFACA